MYQVQASQAVKVFEETENKQWQLPPIVQFSTTCCAFGVLSVKNDHSYEQIKGVIDTLMRNAYSKSWAGTDNNGGERNFAVFISPGESNLEKNLIELGFECAANNLPRRKGYPPGKLKMYLLSI